MEKTNSYANDAFKLIGGMAALATLLSFAFVPALPFAFATFVICSVLYQLTLPRGYSYEINPEDCLSRNIDRSTLTSLSRRYSAPGEESSWVQIVDYYRSVRTPEELRQRIERESQGLQDAREPRQFLQFLEPKG